MEQIEAQIREQLKDDPDADSKILALKERFQEYRELHEPENDSMACEQILSHLQSLQRICSNSIIDGVSTAYSSPACLKLHDLQRRVDSLLAADPTPETLSDDALPLLRETVSTHLEYNPFKEDVFSVGLVVLQMMLMCCQRELEEIRASPELLFKVIKNKFVSRKVREAAEAGILRSPQPKFQEGAEFTLRNTFDGLSFNMGSSFDFGKNLSPRGRNENSHRRYSDNLLCLVLTMLQFSQQDRPDFVELQYLLKDIMRMDNCEHYLLKLLSVKPASTLEDHLKDRPTSRSRPEDFPQYKQLFPSVDEFVSFQCTHNKKHRPTVEQPESHAAQTLQPSDSVQSLYESLTQRGPQRFLPSQIKLTCPIHDNMPFKFLCQDTQTYMCNICVLEKNVVIQSNWVDLQLEANKLGKLFEQKQLQVSRLKKNIQQTKATIRSGKHIDKFFDSLMQDLISLHNSLKEHYRSTMEEKIETQWEEYEREVVDKRVASFSKLAEELASFKKSDRLAEIYLNEEHYEKSLARVEEVLYNYEQYALLMQAQGDDVRRQSKELSDQQLQA